VRVAEMAKAIRAYDRGSRAVEVIELLARPSAGL
jgi:hypothetical protein